MLSLYVKHPLDQDLYPHQMEGWRFLASKKQCLLACEMGTGKTIQAIRGLDFVKSRSSLIVCPSIAKQNWEHEIKKWTLTGLKKIKVTQKLSDINGLSPRNQITICTFDWIASNYQKFIEKLNLEKLDCVIVDECHFLKNHETKRAHAIFSKKGLVHHTERLWLMSGTPMPNHPGELWLMLFVFGQTKLKYDDFLKTFCNTKETGYGLKILSAKKQNIPKLKELLKPIMLRRLKKDVLKLPEITHRYLPVEPGLVDYSMCQTFVEYFFPVAQRHQLLERVQKETKLMEDVFLNVKKEKDKTKALSAIEDSVSAARRTIGLQKVDALVEKISYLIDTNQLKKVVIFAYHVDVIKAVKRGLHQYKPAAIYGASSPKARTKSLKRFRENYGCRVFIGQILAAGTAINLTNASSIYFIEHDWTPGNNAQAVMRCHRIGQKNKVVVKHLIIKGTIDEHITQVLKRKTEDLTDILDTV